MAKKVCLFTAHSPQTGGGAVILRSLIENLPELSVQWQYLSSKPASGYEQGFMGQGIMGSALMNDVISTFQMLSGKNVKRIGQVVEQLLNIECEAYWIVSHNEGLRIAIELARLQHKRPVHLTVHDDWAGALSARSIRYRFMAGLAKKMTIAALQQVSEVDVISRGMQNYYYQLSSVRGEICHRYLPSEDVGSVSRLRQSDSSVINIGHIGSIYDKDDFIEFLNLLKQYEKLKDVKINVNMWGYHPRKNDIPQRFVNMLKMHKDLPEKKAIPELAKCDFVYSMYPQSAKLSVFGQTSLPTKLTSYVQACRPIFGHGPADSTLAEFLQSTGTGIMWSTSDNSSGIAIIEKMLSSDISAINWQKAREHYFGESNLAVMRQSFVSDKHFV